MSNYLSKLVIGTAAWGSIPYGMNQNCPSWREKKAIMELAADHGLHDYHVKPEYDAIIPLKCTRHIEYGVYTLAECDLNAKRLLVPYNPFKQWVVDGLGDYRGSLWVYSIFMQGKLLNESGGYKTCVDLAFGNPWIDNVVVGINSVSELNELIYAIKSINTNHLFVKGLIQCKGPCDETDPRTWEH